MTDPNAIQNQIITILTTADPKNGAGISIKKWFTEKPPPSRYPGFPWGWVEWGSGPMEPPVGSVTEEIDDKFLIAVVDKHINSEKASGSVMEFVSSIETALQTDRSLGGLVNDSWIILREKGRLFEEDYSIIVAKIVLFTRRRK